MKKFFFIAALLMATSAANAGNGVSFQVQGHKIRIEAPRNCESLSCLQISAPSLSDSAIDLKSLKSKRLGGNNDVAATSDTPVQKSTATPVDQAPAPLPPLPSIRDPEPATSTTASAAPLVRDDIISSARSTTSYAPPAPAPAAAAAPATTPLGIWATEDGKGNVRVEQCGANLCGFAANTNEKILINMKPSNDKWSGQIHDPDSGRTYASTIAMKGPNAMRVQGCAFGGMFCGGQTWKRVS
jgi:uncharacterized protein (DUF2147 family)